MLEPVEDDIIAMNDQGLRAFAVEGYIRFLQQIADIAAPLAT